MDSEREERQCNNCGEVWTCTGDDVCRFCGSEDTQPVENEEEYACGYNTVSGAFHKAGCNGECGFMNPGEAVERRRLQKKIRARK